MNRQQSQLAPVNTSKVQKGHTKLTPVEEDYYKFIINDLTLNAAAIFINNISFTYFKKKS